MGLSLVAAGRWVQTLRKTYPFFLSFEKNDLRQRGGEVRIWSQAVPSQFAAGGCYQSRTRGCCRPIGCTVFFVLLSHRSAVVVIDSRGGRLAPAPVPVPVPAPAPAPGGEEQTVVASGGACVRGLDICQISGMSFPSPGGVAVRARYLTVRHFIIDKRRIHQHA